MVDFSIPENVTGDDAPPAPPNFICPFKRPLSSKTPTIVLKDEQLKALVGAKIIPGTTEVFLSHFANRMDPLSAVMAPRYYHQARSSSKKDDNNMIWSCSCSCTLTYCNMETGPRYVIEDHFELPEKKGHNLTSLGGGSIYQFIVQENGHVLAAVSDPRKRVAFQLVINQNYVLTRTLYMIN
ncbi:glutathione hydrolase 1-like [Coffea arabica]|uniref:Glutathione hydrolase 1-like n=1 Tax=Coffea arabica TaxID=13443 RepID=A0A6P6T0F8_COFAR|nr:glutathione hydrolase 1-like [Coffea arabica]